MKLTIIGHEQLYALEQIAAMLFPGSFIKDQKGNDVSGDSAVSESVDGVIKTTLTVGDKTVSASVAAESSEPKKLSYAVRMSFYRAALGILEKRPAWGALSGVRPAKLIIPMACEGEEACIRELTEKYDVSADKARIAAESAIYAAAAAAGSNENCYSLYVGIPFCPTKCRYCSFISRAGADSVYIDSYITALETELKSIEEEQKNKKVYSVYVGGGTPAILNAAQLRRVLEGIREFGIGEDTEYTVEMGRPDCINAEKLNILKEFGVGRICVNPQSLNEDALRIAGRPHGTDAFYEAYSLAAGYGFSINTDLIAGLEGETQKSFIDGVEKIVMLRPDNITIHSLAKKRTADMDNSEIGGEVEEMLQEAEKALRLAGYRPYYLYRQKNTADGSENTGWTLKGKESVYNIIMMEELGTVVSAGAGGVTKEIINGAFKRRKNPKNTDEYIKRLTNI